MNGGCRGGVGGHSSACNSSHCPKVGMWPNSDQRYLRGCLLEVEWSLWGNSLLT